MNKKQIIFHRDQKGYNQSLGTFIVLDKGRVIFWSHLLERGDRNNKRNVSCVLAGLLHLKLEWSPAFERNLWEAYGTPGRSECKIHPASFFTSLKGCFATGECRYDINNDGLKDMVNSTDKFEEFMNCMGDDTEASLLIIDNINKK